MKKLTSLIICLTLSFCAIFTSCKDEAKDKPTTPAAILYEDFKAITKANPEIDLETLSTKLISNKIIPFAPATMPVEEGYLAGFNKEIFGFSEGYTFGPIIGAIPFTGYVLKTDKPEELISLLKSCVNLRWNICTEADEMVIGSEKNIVFCTLSPLSFEDDTE